MKKLFITSFIFMFLFMGYIEAQQVYVPLFRFRCGDENAAEMASLIEPGQNAGGHRYVDGTNILEYHFDLTEYTSVPSDQLFFRVFLWNEYVINFSDIAISDVSQGEQVAIFSEDPANNPVHSGENQAWVTLPLKDYIDFGWTDLYVSFFDGRPEDGWGPSIPLVGIYKLVDKSSLVDNSVPVALGDVDFISIDGSTDEWPTEGTKISIAKGNSGILTTGTVTDNNDLSGEASVSFDKENLYISANVTDDDIVVDNDKLVLYVGLYSLDYGIPTFGHTALTDLTGYRKKREPDYKIEILINGSNPTIFESKIINGVLENTEANISTSSNGYSLEAKVPFASLFLADSVKTTFSIPTKFPDIYNVDNVEIPIIPFAVKLEDYDGSGVSGSLITATDENVDDNPTAWGLTTDLQDLRTATSDVETPKGIVKEWAVGTADVPFVVEGFTGSGNSGSHRWADGYDTLTYKYNLTDLENMAKGLNLFLEFHVWNEFVVQVSGSLTGEKTNVGLWSKVGEPATSGDNVTDVAISLAEMRDKGFEDLYVWISDGIPTTGWGPSTNRIRLYYEGEYNSVALFSWIPGMSTINGDANYLILDNGSQGDDNHRFTDGNNYFAYKFNLDDLKTQQPTDYETELFFNIWGRNEYVITVAETETAQRVDQDTVEIWSKVGEPTHDGSNYGEIGISLKTYIDAGWSNVVFFFYDGIPTDGWGGDYWDANIAYRELLAYYTIDEFVPGRVGTSETNYMVSNHEGSGSDDNHRWADGQTDITYHFNKTEMLAKTNNEDNILFQVGLTNEYIISVKPHLDSTGTVLYKWSEVGEPHHDGANYADKKIYLKEYFDAGWEDVYVVFTDGIPTDGWGPSLYWVGISSLEPATITGVEKIGNIIPQVFTLNQNYPNPFNPETIISYSIPMQAEVTLKVYDILGREVKTLISQVQSPGKYQVMWKGDNNYGSKVSSGVYFYRVSYQNMQLVKKMMMLK